MHPDDEETTTEDALHNPPRGLSERFWPWIGLVLLVAAPFVFLEVYEVARSATNLIDWGEALFLLALGILFLNSGRRHLYYWMRWKKEEFRVGEMPLWSPPWKLSFDELPYTAGIMGGILLIHWGWATAKYIMNDGLTPFMVVYELAATVVFSRVIMEHLLIWRLWAMNQANEAEERSKLATRSDHEAVPGAPGAPGSGTEWNAP